VPYLRRIGVGLAKGLVLGLLLGAALHFGLRWSTSAGLLSTLLAMGAGATAGGLAGKPPWAHSGWLETGLRIFLGMGLGAIFLWLAGRFLAFTVPFSVFGAPNETLWHELPLLYIPFVTSLYAALLELDNDGPARAH
jgi:hypothetical protein